jgi:hypothetical protein
VRHFCNDWIIVVERQKLNEEIKNLGMLLLLRPLVPHQRILFLLLVLPSQWRMHLLLKIIPRFAQEVMYQWIYLEGVVAPPLPKEMPA